jgi:hypothetical protein
LNLGDGHFIFNGKSRLLKMFIFGNANVDQEISCQDVGVNDDYVQQGEDVYGHYCKAPPGVGYVIGTPQGIDPPQPAYGFFFTPILDNPAGDFASHGRAGIGIHGGGSDLGDPLAPRQGWEWTYGCLRLQNADNVTFVNLVRSIQQAGKTVYLDIVWP